MASPSLPSPLKPAPRLAAQSSLEPSSVPAPPAPARVRTVPIDLSDALDVAKLPRQGGLAWLRGGEGLLGWGEAARLEISGPDRCERASLWWERQCARFEVTDSLGIPGSGPIAFGSFGFTDETPSILIVPQVVMGIRDGRAWLTTIDLGNGRSSVDSSDLAGRAGFNGGTHANGGADLSSGAYPQTDTEPVVSSGAVAWLPGEVSESRYLAGVTEAIERIAAGEAAKVVLARDLVARAEAPIDPRYVLGRLAGRFPECWSFLVADLVGATPELLISREGARISSRVLAGTTWPDDAAKPDDAATGAVAALESPATEADHLADQLLLSEKDLIEHAYTAGSVASALAPYCDELFVPDGPSTVRLANVLHLSTQLDGVLSADTSILTLIDVLHPTPAVGGVPTKNALDLISELEPWDRGRYAAPVGWVDAAGNGEFGIALRCAQLRGDTARLFAGCGIVTDSVPERELAESDAKFSAMRVALGG